VALRKRTLYGAQPATQRDSPVHRDDLMRDVLERIRVSELIPPESLVRAFEPRTSTTDMLRIASESSAQEVFPVTDPEGKMVGLVSSALLHVLAAEHDDAPWTLAADIMQPPVSVRPGDHLRTAAERLVAHGLREIPIVDEDHRVLGLLDEAGLARVYVEAARRAERDGRVEPDLDSAVIHLPPSDSD
jgi:CIC family chloride channel protein